MSIQDQRDRQQREGRDRTTRLEKESPIFFLRDSHVAKVAPELPEKYRAGFLTEAAEQKTVLDGFLSERRKVLTSAAFTDVGRQEAIGKAIQKVKADIDARRARVHTRIAEDVQRRARPSSPGPPRRRKTRPCATGGTARLGITSPRSTRSR